MTADAPIRLRTLGDFELQVGDVSVYLRTRKERALLVYLALNRDRRHAREFLVDLIWSQVDAARGRHSLNQAIYALRRHLPGLPVRTDRNWIRLESGSLKVDVEEIRAAYSAGEFEVVRRLYGGEFLGTGMLADSENFEAWREAVFHEVHDVYVAALRRLLSKLEWEGDWRGVEEVAEDLLRADEFDDEVQASRLTAIAAEGDPPRAVLECTKVMRRWETVMGSPNERLGLLLAQLGSHGPQRVEELVNEDSDGGGPFVGRIREFAALREAWERARVGVGGLVIIRGEAGIGKTRLCERLLRLAAIQGARLFHGRCYASEKWLPYGGLVDALSRSIEVSDLRHLEPVWAAAIGELLPEFASGLDGRETLANLPAESARRRLFEAFTQLLHAVAQTRPVLLLVDDFQWSDESTAALVHYIVRRSTDTRILILLAVRTQEMVTDSAAWSLLQDDHDGSADAIDLGELTDEEADRLIAAYGAELGLDLDLPLRHSIFRHTGGRPFIVVETMKAIGNEELEVRNLVYERGAHNATLVIPARIEAFLATRFGRLSPAAVEALQGISVVGRAVSLHLLCQVIGYDRYALIRAVEELVARGFLIESQDHVEVAHELLRDFAYRQITWTRRRHLHRQAGDALVKVPKAGLGIIATHYDLAGEKGKALAFALLAVAESERVYAHLEKERFLRLALANATAADEKRDLELRLGMLLLDLRRFDEAEEIFLKIEREFPQEEANSAQLLELHIARASIHYRKGFAAPGELFTRLRYLADKARSQSEYVSLISVLHMCARAAHDSGDHDGVLGIISELYTIGWEHRNTLIGIEALRIAATFEATYGNLQRALAYSQEALAWARDLAEPAILSSALIAHGMVSVHLGRLGEALSSFSRSLELASAIGAIGSKLRALNDMGVVLVEKGEYAKSKRTYEELFTLDSHIQGFPERTFACLNRSLVALECREFADAKHYCEYVISARNRHFPWWSYVSAHGIMGLCALELGEVAQAYQHRRELRRYFDSRNYWVGDFSYSEIFLARLGALEGERDSAIRRLEEAIAAYENRDICCRLRLQVELARLLAASAPAQARQLAAEVRGRAAEMGARPLVEKAEEVLDRVEHGRARLRAKPP